ncbi:Cell division protein FtsL [Candidatus Entotheonellaceae bacterium PAL068K]
MLRSRPVTSAAVTRRYKRRSQATRHFGVVMLFSTAMVLVGILLYLWPQMRLVDLGYHQGTLQARRIQVLRRQKALQIDLVTLRQLSRVEEIAVERLGMRPPQMSQIIYVRAGQRIADAGRN